MSAPIRTEQNPLLLAEGLRTIIFQKYKTYDKVYPRIFNMHSSKKHTEKDYSMAGLGNFLKRNEGTAVTYDKSLPGYSKTYEHVLWSLAFRITQIMMEDDLYGPMAKLAKNLAKNAMFTEEQETANIFNNAFVNTLPENKGGDGLALCHTAHPLIGGGTYGNRLGTDSDFGVSSLQAMILLMKRTVNDRGQFDRIVPKMILHAPELTWEVDEVLNSTHKPYTADNEINALRRNRLSAMEWMYLTDEDAWFLLADKDDHDLNFFWRKKLTTDSDVDFDTDDLKFKASMRFSCGFLDWRGVYGTPGA